MEIPLLPTFRFIHSAMGTDFEVLISGHLQKNAAKVSTALFNEIDRMENLLSRFKPQSEISRINRLKPGESMFLSSETFRCLDIARSVQTETGGAFDINTRALERYGNESPHPAENRCSLSLFQCLLLSQSAGRFEAKIRNDTEFARIDLDLGGIGKGFALEKCLDILSKWEIGRALVQGSASTVMAVGSPSEFRPGWTVGLAENWTCPETRNYVLLKDRTLSASGVDKKGAHIIDPRTGIPANGHLASFVSHPSAAVADALSTAFMVMSTKEIQSYCERKKDVWALVIKGNKSCRVFNQNIFSESLHQKHLSTIKKK